MPKRKIPVPPRTQPGLPAELRRVLAQRKKTELVDLLMELEQGDRGILRRLTGRFDVTTTEELVAATRQAIADATDLTKCDLPAGEAIAWCSAMLDSDRVGFIAEKPLLAPRQRVQTAAPQ
jgi:hypothetical protein